MSDKKKLKVFLGGTCNGSTWRELLIPLIHTDYFNPVVPNWTPECMVEERKQRETCDYCLYVITPKMTGVYSIAEVIDDAHMRPEKTLFVIHPQDDGAEFTHSQMESMNQVGEMAVRRGATRFPSLYALAEYLNEQQHKQNAVKDN